MIRGWPTMSVLKRLSAELLPASMPIEPANSSWEGPKEGFPAKLPFTPAYVPSEISELEIEPLVKTPMSSVFFKIIFSNDAVAPWVTSTPVVNPTTVLLTNRALAVEKVSLVTRMPVCGVDDPTMTLLIARRWSFTCAIGKTPIPDPVATAEGTKKLFVAVTSATIFPVPPIPRVSSNRFLFMVALTCNEPVPDTYTGPKKWLDWKFAVIARSPVPER